MKRKLLPIFISICLLNIAVSLDASPVKISFFESENALNQTTDFLISKGCTLNSINLFRTVVHWNNEAPLGFDIKKFPKNEDGFYSFQSISNLVEALPQPII